MVGSQPGHFPISAMQSYHKNYQRKSIYGSGINSISSIGEWHRADGDWGWQGDWDWSAGIKQIESDRCQNKFQIHSFTNVNVYTLFQTSQRNGIGFAGEGAGGARGMGRMAKEKKKLIIQIRKHKFFICTSNKTDKQADGIA